MGALLVAAGILTSQVKDEAGGPPAASGPPAAPFWMALKAASSVIMPLQMLATTTGPALKMFCKWSMSNFARA